MSVHVYPNTKLLCVPIVIVIFIVQELFVPVYMSELSELLCLSLFNCLFLHILNRQK